MTRKLTKEEKEQKQKEEAILYVKKKKLNKLAEILNSQYNFFIEKGS